VSESFAKPFARFAESYAAVRDLVDAEYVRPDWARRNAELERDLLPVPPADFLRHPAIRFQMFVNERFLPHELPFVRGRLSTTDLLAEDPVGAPPTVPVAGTLVRTSSNTVHQMYHLLRYEHATRRRVADAATIVEWGGGFGSLARLVVRMHTCAPTYVVIDTPIFSALQHLYLSAVFGDDRVVLHTAGPVHPQVGRINIVPVGLLGALTVAADLFISTWALNESTRTAQREVVDRDWFGADALLLAMHTGDPLTAIACGHGAHPVPIGDFLPGQQYLVA
jgi:hypothetical protein